MRSFKDTFETAWFLVHQFIEIDSLLLALIVFLAWIDLVWCLWCSVVIPPVSSLVRPSTERTKQVIHDCCLSKAPLKIHIRFPDPQRLALNVLVAVTVVVRKPHRVRWKESPCRMLADVTVVIAYLLVMPCLLQCSSGDVVWWLLQRLYVLGSDVFPRNASPHPLVGW